MTRVAVVDAGSNSTRLLVADVEGGRVARELARQSTVTRLAAGVQDAGALDPAAIARVEAVLARYHERWTALGAQRAVAVLTSAVRDARDGAAFARRIAERFALEAHVLEGEQEAALTFAGATSERTADTRDVVVIDIGGGSTELAAGDGWARSLQLGVVRGTERFLPSDPPAAAELAALRDHAAGLLRAQARNGITDAIAVAGTATSCASILREVEPYDPARVHGARVRRDELEALLDRLAALPLAERRRVRGLHPDRAPMMVAGVLILVEALRAFGLDAVEVSEHDLLRGAALAWSDGGGTGTG